MLRLSAIALLVLALFASACGGDTAESAGSLTISTPIPAPTPEGERIEGFAPDFDQGVVVVGYGLGDSIELRARPGVDQLVLNEIPGDAVGLTGLGETFVTPDDRTWWFVRWDNTQGWIEPGAAYLGAPEDITGEAVASLSAASFESASFIVQELTANFASDAGDRFVVVATQQPTNGAPAITVADVLVGDPSETNVGQRLTITITGSTGNFALESVAQQPLCARGLTDSGSCS